MISGCVEQLDNRRNRARMLVQRGKECLRWERTPFGERYLKGNLKIGLRCIDFGPPYYGVILEALPNAAETPSACIIGKGDAVLTREHLDSDQTLMFPGNVECVEVEQVRVPSRPRLQIFDDFSVGTGKQSYLFLSRVFPLKEASARAADGELNTYWVQMTVALGEGIGEQIEAAPQAVYDHAGFGIHNGRQPPDVGELVELLAVLRVELFDQIVWATFPPCFNPRLKNWDLGVGPINPSLSV
jgi:hypothetical protein